MKLKPPTEPTQASPMGAAAPQEEAPVQETPAQPTQGTAAPEADPEVMQQIDDRMNELPDNQKEFILKFMAPELVACFGIVFGNDALEYFSQFADPSKMLQVVPRPADPQGNPQPTGAAEVAPQAQAAPAASQAPMMGA